MLTALCPEAVVNLNVPHEVWYVQCHKALQGLENVEKRFLLEMAEKGLEEGGGEGRADQRDG